MNQLTTTKYKHFTMENGIMEKVFDAVQDYHFTVVSIDGHKYWIGNELAHAFEYSTPTNMFKTMKKEDVHKKVIVKKQPKNANENWHKNRMEGLYDLAPLLMDSSATLKKEGAESHWGKINFDKLNTLILVREDTLQNYLTVYATKPDAKDVGKKLYEYLSSGKTLVEVFEEESNPLKDLIYTEAERLDLSKEFISWYWGMVKGIYWFEKLDYRSNMLNGLKCLIANYTTLESRYMVVTGKNSAKKILKKQGASSQMISSYLRRWNRSERMYNWQMSQSLRFHFSLNWG